jgi:hypothetical protein
MHLHGHSTGYIPASYKPIHSVAKAYSCTCDYVVQQIHTNQEWLGNLTEPIFFLVRVEVLFTCGLFIGVNPVDFTQSCQVLQYFTGC